MNEYVHFLEEVISIHEERNLHKRGKYIGRVSFDSICLDYQDKLSYTGYNEPREKPTK